MTVIATAGHVDHGKSTLVKALTGIDPDRLPQERARGLTLDLGFAPVRLPSGQLVSFVDVPGHERLVGTMVMGASPAAGCLFVVDAHEGWRRQSHEHLRILDLLKVQHGVVALTKAAALEPGAVVDVITKVRGHLMGSVFAAAEIVPVDAISKIGLDALVNALEHMLDTIPPAVDEGRPRLWVDRSFSIRGSGTVVTGTLSGGVLELGQRVTVLPRALSTQIRRIEEYGESRPRARPGSRTALNLASIGRNAIGRGDVIVPEKDSLRTHEFVAEVRVLEDAPKLASRGAWMLHLGTRVILPRFRIHGGVVEPGQTGSVLVRLPEALPVAIADRFIVRDAGRDVTVAGGSIVALGWPARWRPLRTMPVQSAPDVHPFLVELRTRPWPPPNPTDVATAELGALRATGLAVSHEGVWFAVETLDSAARRITELLATKPCGVTVAEVRDLFGSTRRPTLALLALLDARGITTRKGNLRVLGP